MKRLARQGSWRRKLLFTTIALLLLSIIVAAAFFYCRTTNKPMQDISTSEGTIKEAAKDGQTVVFSAMGDMIAHDTITTNAKVSGEYNYRSYFQKIQPLYNSSDVVFCNQESLSAGETYGISGYPAFNAPVKYAADLQAVGCNMINLANNHMADKGQEPLDATVRTWEKLKPLAYAGANRSAEEQKSVRYFEKNNIKFAFLAFADFSNNKDVTDYGLNIYHNETLLETLVKEARKNADAVIVSMHWGDEDSHEVNQDQYAQVQELANYGADVIIGTGPHVLQKTEYITRPDGQKMLVWYSIGNMLSSQLQLDELTGGVAQWIIRRTGNKITIENPVFKPTYMSYEWTAAQQNSQDTDARRNPMIYPLKDAGEALQAMRMGSTPVQVKQQVQRILGPEVVVE